VKLPLLACPQPKTIIFTTSRSKCESFNKKITYVVMRLVIINCFIIACIILTCEKTIIYLTNFIVTTNSLVRRAILGIEIGANCLKQSIQGSHCVYVKSLAVSTMTRMSIGGVPIEIFMRCPSTEVVIILGWIALTIFFFLKKEARESEWWKAF